MTKPTKSLRITFITHYTELYGANLSLLNLIEGLRKYEVQSHVLCPDQGDLLPALAERNIPAAQLPFEWWVSTKPTVLGALQRLYSNIRNLGRLAKQLSEWQTDLVYSNASVFSIGAMLSARLRLPHIWHLREFGNRDYDLWPDWGARISRFVFRTADANIFVSKALRRAFFGDRSYQRSYVIYNGVASESVFDDRYRLAQELQRQRSPFTFVLVGRFRESKGQGIAIQAFAKVVNRFPNTRLLLVGGAGQTGDQSYFNECRTLANDLKVSDRVEFWGYIPDPERAFLAADVALMCSRNEAMGRVTVEAMSACRAVIGYDSGGTSELIDPNRTGLLYRGNADALAECMIRYIENPRMAQEHGEAGWRQARIRHTTETYAEQVYEVIRKVCGNRLGSNREKKIA